LGGSPAPSAGASQAVVPTAHFAGDAFGFDDPADWRGRPGVINPGGNRTVTYLSPQDLVSECSDTAQGSVCGSWPRIHLAPDGVVVAWRTHGRPGSRPPSTGDEISVGGRLTLVTDGAPDPECAAIGGDEMVTVAMPAPPPATGWSSLEGCIDGSDNAAALPDIAAIEASVVWASP
jgi:hypothetical protein